MLTFYSAVVISCSALCAYLIYWAIRRLTLLKTLPPGPFGLPFLGVLPWLRPSTAHVTLTEWSKVYGPIFSFSLGNNIFVCLADGKVIKEALVKRADVFSGRPTVPAVTLTNKNHGLVMSNGPRFKEQRRFALSTLRDLGFGKPVLENSIKEEIEVLIEEIRKRNGKAEDFQSEYNNAVSNVICSLTFGKRFEYTDERFRILMDHLSVIISRNGQNIFSLPNHIPGLVSLFHLPISNPVKSNVLRMRQVEAFSNELIKEHQKSYSKENEPEDYIHAFMQAKEEDSSGSYFTDFQLLQSVISLFAAGTETTSTTLRWATLFMAHNPEVQRKIRAEISDLVGTGNIPDLKDRPKLPYTEATICEIQRLASLAPTAVPHKLDADVEFEGYTLPKDTLVIPLLWAVHRDPQIFPDPSKFDPERFLDEEHKQKRMEALIPFSVGKRACLGESLAKMELFLFFTAFIQSFHFELEPDQSIVTTNYDEERLTGITSSPLSFKVRALPV